jgi:acyl-CoA dehydrogenase
MSSSENRSDVDRLVNILLTGSLVRKTFGSMAAWFKDFNEQTRPFIMPIDRAIIGGSLSLNVGFAFASAYQSAIEALFQPQDSRLSSFCVTEEKGNHPRDIQTRLFIESGQLLISGSKKFVSGANDSQRLFIAGRDERDSNGLDKQGRPVLKMVELCTPSKGLKIEEMPALGFVPEISHGKVQLDNVHITEKQILKGDGYLDYLKAFRNYEDLYVLAAITGYRLGESLDGQWPKDTIENHIALLLAIRSLSSMNLSKAAAHIGLAACRAQLKALILNTNSLFESSNPNAYGLWDRDKVLLDIAKTAHQKRTQNAWDGL